jgi:hypothetical protein
VKKEQVVKEDKTVRLHLSEHREKNTKKRSTKRHTSTYIVAQIETTVKERAGFGHRNRLRVSKVAGVDKEIKSERKQRTPS